MTECMHFFKQFEFQHNLIEKTKLKIMIENVEIFSSIFKIIILNLSLVSESTGSLCILPLNDQVMELF